MTVRLPIASSEEVWRAGWGVVRRHRARAGVVFALFVAQACVLALPPILMGVIVDRVRTGRHDVGWVLTALVVAAVFSGVLEWQGRWRLTLLVEPEIARIREEFVAAIARRGANGPDAADSADVVSRASDDVQVISDGASRVLATTLSTAIALVVVGVGLGALDPRFLLSLVVIVPLVAGAMRWYLRVGPKTYLAERDAQAVRARHVLDTVRAARTLRAYGLERRQVDVVREASWAHVRWEMRVRIVQNILLARVNVLELVGLLSVVAIGAWVALSGAGAGVVTAGVLLYLRVMAPISQLLFIADDWQSILTALARVLGVTVSSGSSGGPAADHARSTAEVQREAGAVQRPSPREDAVVAPGSPGVIVRLDAVSHHYGSGPNVLHDVSLSIQEGEHVALVGSSGSGKSTLAAIIAGQLDPTVGVRSTHVDARQIATVTQENHVLAATLRDNLTIAAPGADDATLLHAVRGIGADGLMGACSDGLDTRLGAGGVDLDPASAQLLALVRLHLVAPTLVVLDEATAEAGVSDARRVEHAARAVIDGRAALVVAHRLSQAQACDVVVVLERGRIVERGAPAELLERGGAYARLWKVWRKGR